MNLKILLTFFAVSCLNAMKPGGLNETTVNETAVAASCENCRCEYFRANGEQCSKQIDPSKGVSFCSFHLCANCKKRPTQVLLEQDSEMGVSYFSCCPECYELFEHLEVRFSFSEINSDGSCKICKESKSYQKYLEILNSRAVTLN